MLGVLRPADRLVPGLCRRGDLLAGSDVPASIAFAADSFAAVTAAGATPGATGEESTTQPRKPLSVDGAASTSRSIHSSAAERLQGGLLVLALPRPCEARVRPDDADGGVGGERVDRGRHDPDGDAPPAGGGSDQVHHQGQATHARLPPRARSARLPFRARAMPRAANTIDPTSGIPASSTDPHHALGGEYELVLRREATPPRPPQHAEADDRGPQPRARLVPPSLVSLLPFGRRQVMLTISGHGGPKPRRTPRRRSRTDCQVSVLIASNSPGFGRPARRPAGAPGQAAGQGTRLRTSGA